MCLGSQCSDVQFFFSLSVWIDTGTYIGNSAVLGKWKEVEQVLILSELSSLTYVHVGTMPLFPVFVSCETYTVLFQTDFSFTDID